MKKTKNKISKYSSFTKLKNFIFEIVRKYKKKRLKLGE